jgi:hypothetical protein
MTIHPPRLTAWLVNLFAPAEESESILGDLHEEFTHLTSTSGIAHARKWYGRHALTTIADLTVAGFRAAPWSTLAAVVASWVLVRYGMRLSNIAVEALLDKYQVWEKHYEAYLPWVSVTIGVRHIIVTMLAGGIVALAAKGREMTVTVALGIFMIALTIIGLVTGIARTGDYGQLWTFPWMFASVIAAVAAGALVRTRRLRQMPNKTA